MNRSNDNGPTLRTGVIGLGMIGGGVATSLSRSGFSPIVYDIRPEAADLPGAPELVASPAEVAAGSDVVFVAVVNADQAAEVLNGEQGLLRGARPGLIVVLLSTVSLVSVTRLSELCAEHAVTLLDCGVTPGDKAAENGMVAMVGGDDEPVERARPALAGFAKAVVHCGPLGAGMATKLARNVVTYGSWRTVSEAASLAGSAGVSPETLIEVIETADPEGTTALMLLRQLQTDSAEAVAEQIRPLMSKDLEAAKQLAAASGLDLPLVDVAHDRAAETLNLDQGAPLHELTPPAEVGTASDETRPAAVASGLSMMDAVYGAGFSQNMPRSGTAFEKETEDHLFGEIWSRPGLSVRDRRLLVLGATAALGDSELIRTQVSGALANHELTAAQLDEAVLHLAYYVGWGRATSVHRGVAAAEADHDSQNQPR